MRVKYETSELKGKVKVTQELDHYRKRRQVKFLSCLFGEDIIGKGSDAGGVGDEVSDGFHDVPRIDPPGEPGQSSALHRQQGQACPDNPGGVDLRSLRQLRLHLSSSEKSTAVLADSQFQDVRTLSHFHYLL